jgi:transcription initiation factor IIE alpha subunit
MFDLDHAGFDFACPECHFLNSATSRQVRLGSRVICRGCKKPLLLVDKDASVNKARRRVDEELAALKTALKLEIKF